MFRNYACLSLIGAVALTACSVVPEQAPQYTQNRAPVSYAQPVNASYQTTQSRAAEQDCRRQETNRELIGGAVGGSVGAYAGKKVIGGTKGIVAGAALGGIVGYGIGDISTNCAPSSVQSSAPAYSNAGYQSAPAYNATPANYEQMRCPVGTRPHSSGSCLLDDPNAKLNSETFTGVPTPAPQQVQAPARTQQYVITASTSPVSAPMAAPIAAPVSAPIYTPVGTSVTRQSGAANYRVVSGDTVYSLARRLCVPVTSIQGSNGLDANYGIQIGQSLQLPNSQC